MKRKITDNKELKLISGGEIIRNNNGSYLLRGTSDRGNDIAIRYGRGELMYAVEYEWYMCEKEIRRANIADSMENLMRYYEKKFYEDFELKIPDLLKQN